MWLTVLKKKSYMKVASLKRFELLKNILIIRPNKKKNLHLKAANAHQ
jgi:hypothetical protein